MACGEWWWPLLALLDVPDLKTCQNCPLFSQNGRPLFPNLSQSWGANCSWNESPRARQLSVAEIALKEVTAGRVCPQHSEQLRQKSRLLGGGLGLALLLILRMFTPVLWLHARLRLRPVSAAGNAFCLPRSPSPLMTRFP